MMLLDATGAVSSISHPPARSTSLSRPFAASAVASAAAPAPSPSPVVLSVTAARRSEPRSARPNAVAPSSPELGTSANYK